MTFSSVSASVESLPPSVPPAERAPVAEIVHLYATPGTASCESHVQSTVAPTSDHEATSAPVTSVTLTVHGAEPLSFAVKRTGPPTSPETTGV